jgi:hypothetical protein
VTERDLLTLDVCPEGDEQIAAAVSETTQSADALPKYGRTVQAHVEHQLTEASVTIAQFLARIRTPKRLTKAEREHFWRELAGVVSTGEMVRIWLDAGAI